MTNSFTDTEPISALASAQGSSAIAVVRISGRNSLELVGKMSSVLPKTPNKSFLNKILNSNGEVIDQTITTYFKAPKSFTGEDMVEISFHGGNAVINSFLDSFKNKHKDF